MLSRTGRKKGQIGLSTKPSAGALVPIAGMHLDESRPAALLERISLSVGL